jgi:hypothetical protein
MHKTLLFLAIGGFCGLFFAAPARGDDSGAAMADAARRFLAALDENQ